jgi:hypothetical protein
MLIVYKLVFIMDLFMEFLFSIIPLVGSIIYKKVSPLSFKKSVSNSEKTNSVLIGGMSSDTQMVACTYSFRCTLIFLISFVVVMTCFLLTCLLFVSILS